MVTIDIVLRNIIGEELDRVTVGQNESEAKRLSELLADGTWVLNEGDTISIEGAYHEEVQ